MMSSVSRFGSKVALVSRIGRSAKVSSAKADLVLQLVLLSFTMASSGPREGDEEKVH